MPKVVYTAAKGLVQEAGSGFNITGATTLTGDVAVTGELTAYKKDIVATTSTLTTSNSGVVLVPTAGAAQTFTLPAVADSAGFHATLLVGSAQAHVIAAPTACIKGAIFDNTNGTTLARTAIEVAVTSITLANPKIGDYITIVGNGTNYFVFGWCNDTPTTA